MKTRYPPLRLRQVDAALAPWRGGKLAQRPPSGWIKTIREALGIPSKRLAARLGVQPSTVTRLERSEAEDSISLATLRRAAAAMDCELQYALVPRQGLAEILQDRALAIARDQMASVSHSMALESQATDPQEQEAQVHALAEALLRGSPRALWQDDKPA